MIGARNSVAQSIGEFGRREAAVAEAASASEVRPVRAVDTRLLLVNSTIAFAIALPLMITIHEFAHALASSVQGLRPVVYPGQVVNQVVGTTDQQVVHLLAGPIGSLLLGVVILMVAPAVRGFWGLFLLWFGALNVQEFTGYLMTGPFLAIGDVGAALHLLGAPAWVYWLLFLAGVGGMMLLGRHFTARLLAMTDAAGDLQAQLRGLGLFAWLLGAGLTLGYGLVGSLLNGGASGAFTQVGLIEAVATLTSGVFVFAVRLFMRTDVPGRPISVGWTWPIAGLAIAIAVELARTFVLGPGLPV
jgi:hypothetical protein